MLGRNCMRQAKALSLRSQHLRQLAPVQHQGLQLLQRRICQRLDEALALRMLVQHPGEGREHARIQGVGLGQCAHRASKVARGERVDHGHRQARGLKRAGRLELIVASGLKHYQSGRQGRCLTDQLLDAAGVVGNLPSWSPCAMRQALDDFEHNVMVSGDTVAPDRCRFIATHGRASSVFQSICFALRRRLWWNRVNFPKGGWPGVRWEHRSASHGEPFAPEPYV
jgi:hypothetical protein